MVKHMCHIFEEKWYALRIKKDRKNQTQYVMTFCIIKNFINLEEGFIEL